MLHALYNIGMGFGYDPTRFHGIVDYGIAEISVFQELIGKLGNGTIGTGKAPHQLGKANVAIKLGPLCHFPIDSVVCCNKPLR